MNPWNLRITRKTMSMKKIIKLRNENGISLAESIKKIKPDKFGFDDVAQQVVGAFLLAAPFSVTEEVWTLAKNLTPLRLVLIVFFTIFITTLIIYYTRFQKVTIEGIGKLSIPRRLISLFLISYSTSFFILWVFGIIGTEIKDMYWSFKLVILVSFFSSLGAATADIIK